MTSNIRSTIEMLDPVAIDVDQNAKECPFATIIFGHDSNVCEIDLSRENFNELGQRMFPSGLIPDDFPSKIIMLNQLIEDLDIRDKENPDWRISKVEYIGGDEDLIQFDCKAVE